jgi:pSer/pThr/pTyr-binding forkhead associated (FHA) protein
VSEWRLEYRGTLFPFRGVELTLGRSNYASIVVNNPRASREHAVVRAAGSKLEIMDLGSRNGTLVNGTRITTPQRLEVGDRIQIGVDVIEVVRASPEDPLRLRAETLSGRQAAAPGLDEGQTTEIAEKL